MQELSPTQSEPQTLALPDAEVTLWSHAFDVPAADRLQQALTDRIPWRQEEISLFGRRHLVPRLVAWHGDPGAAYTYSGTYHEPLPWTDELLEVKARIEALAGHGFNSVLLNRYRDGRDG